MQNRNVKATCNNKEEEKCHLNGHRKRFSHSFKCKTVFHNYIFVHGSESLGKEKLLLTVVTLTRKIRYKTTPLNFIFSMSSWDKTT